MLRSARSMIHIVVVAWPELLAWYLAGQVVRAAVIAIAAPIGPVSPLAALLIVPIAALASLVSYVGMFLAVRRGMAAYRNIAEGDVEFTSPRDAVAEFSRVLLASIIPFFTLYALIGLLAYDLSEYARSAFRFSLGSERGVLDVGDGPVVATVVIVALAGRLALKVFGSRLPRWLAVVEIYLEATWIFVALTGLYGAFGDILEWVESRAVFVWVDDARNYLSSLADPIRWIFESVDWALPVAVQLVLLPLAWLLVAGIVYTRALANVVEGPSVPRAMERAANLAQRGYLVLPAAIKRQAYLLTDEWDDVGSPLTQSAKLVSRAGLTALVSFMGVYALLFAAGQWLSFALYRAIGPQESSLWFELDPLVSIVDNLVTEPLRIALLAVMFDGCLRRWQERRSGAASESARAEAGVSRA